MKEKYRQLKSTVYSILHYSGIRRYAIYFGRYRPRHILQDRNFHTYRQGNVTNHRTQNYLEVYCNLYLPSFDKEDKKFCSDLTSPARSLLLFLHIL
jgi:hypothetical protein